MKKIDDILNYFLYHKKILAVMIAILYIIGVIFPLRNSENVKLENIYYLSQILSGYFVVAGVAIALLQYSSNNNDRRVDNQKQKKLEAAKLANMFREQVLPLSAEITTIYKVSGISKNLIDYLSKQDLQDFNAAEIKRLFPDKKHMEYQINLAVAYWLIENNSKIEPENISSINNSEIETSLTCVSNKCTNLANILEYFSICFNAEIADDDTVYQSLHQILFSSVQMLYIFIFLSNTNECDRLYYNLATLYKRWKTKNTEKIKEEDAIEKKTRESQRSAKESIVVKSKKE